MHYVALLTVLAPGKTDHYYIRTACHTRKTTTYILHVVTITTYTHDRRKSSGQNKHRKENKVEERKDKKAKNEKGKERKEKTRKARKDKTRGSKEREIEK